ncbi:MAG: hypothetical protein ACWGNP_02000, partial [Candidatus Bathyarchaeia archaeon]
MKITLTKRILAAILVASLVLAAVNMYLIFDLRRALEGAGNDWLYDYVVFQDGDVYKGRNQRSSNVDFTSADAAFVITQAVAAGNTVYVQAGNYTLNSDIQVFNKQNAKIVGDGGAVIVGDGNKLVVKGDTYASSQNNRVSGLTVINGTLRVENSFGTTVSNMEFVYCTTALELANTNTWSEGTKIEDCRFASCTESIVFRTPTDKATGSYASSKISRCFFNIADDSVGITVEENAEFSDSQLEDLRLWMGEGDFTRNQTGLRVDGSMHQTFLFNGVFESFADYPDQMYAIALGETSVTPPTLSGVSFLGNWTTKVYNPHGKWISGVGSLFKQDKLNIPLGLNGQYGETLEFQMRPNTILSFKPEIQVEGDFSYNETVTVRFRLEFLDNTFSPSVEKSFTNSTSMWLSDD